MRACVVCVCLYLGGLRLIAMDLAQTPPKDLLVGTPPGADGSQTGASATTPVSRFTPDHASFSLLVFTPDHASFSLLVFLEDC